MDDSCKMETLKSVSDFLHLTDRDLEEARTRKRKKFKDWKPTSLEEFFLLKTVLDLQSVRAEYEDGIRSLDQLKLWQQQVRGQGAKDAALSHLLAGLRQHTFVEHYTEVALERSVETAVAYLQRWDQEQGSRTLADSHSYEEAFDRFMAAKNSSSLSKPDTDTVAKLNPSTNNDWPSNLTEVKMFGGQPSVVVKFEAEIGSASVKLEGDVQRGSSTSRPDPELKDQPSNFQEAGAKGLGAIARCKPRPKRHMCPHCGKAFAIKLNYNLHVRGHEDAKTTTTTTFETLSCAICRKTFSHKGSLVQHMSVHSVKRYPCLVCDTRLKTRMHVVKHMWRVHQMIIKQDDLRNKGCTTCGKKFYTQEDLDTHAVSHTDAFKCEVCAKSFHTAVNLERHLKIHQEKREHVAVTTSNDSLVNVVDTAAIDLMEDPALKMLPPAQDSATIMNSAERQGDVSNLDLRPDMAHSSDSQSRALADDNPQRTEVTNATEIQKPKWDFKCSLCDKLFKTRWKLKEHQRSHTGEKPFKCEICQKPFAYKGNLKDHYATHAFMDCPRSCGRTFDSRVQLARHLKEDHHPTSDGDQRPQPLLGDVGLLDDDDLQRLPDILSKVDQFRGCTGEDASANEKSKDKEKKNYDCEYCGKMFDHRWKFTEHVRTHTGERPFKCDICARTFGKKTTLRDHYELHSDVNHPCPYCGKAFNTRVQMRRHIKDRCNLIEPEKCPHCIRTFKSRQRLEYHVRIHAEDKQFTCDVCGKAFHDNRSLDRHKKALHAKVKIEEDGEDHQAVSSRATSAQKAALAKAKKLEKRHMCSECGKRFSDRTKLGYHMNIHTGERPYKCPVCPKDFTSSIALFTHKDIHTDEKFPCNVCAKVFNTRACLYKHKENMHKVKRVVAVAKTQSGS